MAAAGRSRAAPADPAPAPQRVLPLEGGRNFRDLGGYAAADGRTVRWGLLYRSGGMAGLTAADYAHLDTLGLASLCDFRTPAEREAEPTVWAGTAKPDSWTHDVASLRGDLARMFDAGAMPSAAAMRDAMLGLYADLPEAQAPGYAELFRRLVAGAVPLVFNCTAGKDRTGVAAALVLTALGVPRETVREDYLLTDAAADFGRMAPGRKALDALAQLPPDVLAPLLSADPAYLDAAFAAIETRYGSIETYLAERLGVGAAALDRLRARYLQ